MGREIEYDAFVGKKWQNQEFYYIWIKIFDPIIPWERKNMVHREHKYNLVSSDLWVFFYHLMNGSPNKLLFSMEVAKKLYLLRKFTLFTMRRRLCYCQEIFFRNKLTWRFRMGGILVEQCVEGQILPWQQV